MMKEAFDLFDEFDYDEVDGCDIEREIEGLTA